jgi:hypothetical protein
LRGEPLFGRISGARGSPFARKRAPSAPGMGIDLEVQVLSKAGDGD